jgi:hypothetical protein
VAGNASSSSITACSNAAKHDIIVIVMVGVTKGEDEESGVESKWRVVQT